MDADTNVVEQPQSDDAAAEVTVQEPEVTETPDAETETAQDEQPKTEIDEDVAVTGDPAEPAADEDSTDTADGESEDGGAGEQPADDADDGEEKDGDSEDGDEPATEEPPKLVVILPRQGAGMSAREMIGVAPVVVGAVRISGYSGMSNDIGTTRYMPGMKLPEGWVLGSEFELRHNNRAHCGTWRIDAIYTRGEDGSLVTQQVPEGPDPKGRGANNAQKDKLKICVFDPNRSIRVNYLWDPEFRIDEGAMDKAFTDAVATRKARVKAAADKKAAETEAAANAAAVTGQAAILEAAIAQYREDREGSDELPELPVDRDEQIAVLVDNGYLERAEDGTLSETDTSLADALEASLEAKKEAAPKPQPPAQGSEAAVSGKHGTGKNRNRNRQPLAAGVQGTASRA